LLARRPDGIFVTPSERGEIGHLSRKACGRPKEISPKSGIDILTSVGTSRFQDHYDRARWQDIADLTLPFLACDDLEAISPRKSE
jgi:hypothetical protein